MAAQEGALSEKALDEALQVLRGRIADIEARRADLDAKVSKLREEEMLLSRLLALRRGAPAPSPSKTSARPATSKPIVGGNGRTGVLAAVEAELLKAGRPLHISDLMRLLIDQAVTIPGAGSQANLISCIRRDNRIVRPSRGMYGLAAWGLAEMSRVSRKKRRRRGRSAGTPQPKANR